MVCVMSQRRIMDSYRSEPLAGLLIPRAALARFTLQRSLVVSVNQERLNQERLTHARQPNPKG